MERKVMIVDDEPGIRLTVRAILESRGFLVLPVENGERCIEELENGFKGVILMDIMMPGMNGWDTIREIDKRGLDEGTLVAMLSAHQDTGGNRAELNDYAIPYIVKPFEPMELVNKVTEYCTFLAEAEKALTQHKT